MKRSHVGPPSHGPGDADESDDVGSTSRRLRSSIHTVPGPCTHTARYLGMVVKLATVLQLFLGKFGPGEFQGRDASRSPFSAHCRTHEWLELQDLLDDLPSPLSQRGGIRRQGTIGRTQCLKPPTNPPEQPPQRSVGFAGSPFCVGVAGCARTRAILWARRLTYR